MKIKNITAALLVLCIMTVNSVFAQKSEDYTKALNSLEIFKNLSVTLPEKNMQDTVTRAEFVSMIMHASEGNDFSVKIKQNADHKIFLKHTRISSGNQAAIKNNV